MKRFNASHHVVFEDSLDHRSEHFNHDHGPRPLPTVLPYMENTHTRETHRYFKSSSPTVGVCLSESSSSPYRRTHTGQVVGGCSPEEERWPGHTHTHTDKYSHSSVLVRLTAAVEIQPLGTNMASSLRTSLHPETDSHTHSHTHVEHGYFLVCVWTAERVYVCSSHTLTTMMFSCS